MKKKFDEKSFAGFQAGNPQDYTLMYNYYYKTVHFVTILLPETDPYKLVIIDDTFFKAWERKESFPSIVHLVRWLRLVAYYKTISRLRECAVEKKHLEGLSYVSEKTEDGANPEEAHEKKNEWLKKHLVGLPPVSQLIIRLSFWEKKSNAEIARILNLSIEAVATRKCRILKLLRARMVNPGFE
jgi:RNA polymerase sigma factor (sigma-70 family)